MLMTLVYDIAVTAIYMLITKVYDITVIAIYMLMTVVYDIAVIAIYIHADNYSIRYSSYSYIYTC